MKCYGEMEVSLDKWDSGTGTANCRPITTTGAPQGYIADGEDGSHWVINLKLMIITARAHYV